MTSPANQQNSVSATNTSANSAASYASAAGAPQKPAQTQPPVVAPGSQPDAAASSASPAQNAKPASESLNGKPPVAPAVPAVSSRGSTNGAHSRQSSVTMASNGPNSFNANGGPGAAAKSGIQFGFGSPSVAQSSPQTGNSAPIAIPGGNNPRVASPANSPSPIPQSTSGGRPPSGIQQPGGQMTFGSLNSTDGERHMRQGSVPPNPNAMGAQQPGTHFRRESNQSVHSEGPGGPGRGNFQQGGRGRGYPQQHNNYNHQMGYPPNNQFRNGPGQGRGMPAAFQPAGPRNMPYPHSPQPNHRSPAMVPSMPGTPNMPPSQMQAAVPPYYGQPMPGQGQQVQSPFPNPDPHPQPQPHKFPFKNSKKARSHRDVDRTATAFAPRVSSRHGASREPNASFSRPPVRRPKGHFDRQNINDEVGMLHEAPYPDGRWEKSPDQAPPPFAPRPAMGFEAQRPTNLDMSPGNYEQLLLTAQHQQNFGYPPQDYRGNYGYPQNMQGYMHPPQPNSPGYNQGFVAPYHHQASHSMSRTPSQPERPSSANQHGPAVAMGSNNRQTTPSQTNSEVFSKPGRKSAAIQIKTASGEVLDTSSFKAAPASPAPSGSQQAKTPPVTSANPTPPPKASTPSHGRTDSLSTHKTAKEIQDELKEKIKQATQTKSDAASTDSEKPKSEAPALSSEKPAEESAAAKPEAEKAPEPAKKDDGPDEDEMERMIREMEEEDARREKEEEAHRIKAAAEKEAAKKKAEEDRKKNAADEDAKLREQEREMERIEDEKERKRQEAEASGKTQSVEDVLAGKEVDSVTDKLGDMKIGDKDESKTSEKRGAKPAALNLAPLNTKPVEPPQPSAALQSLKSARFLQVMDQDVYPTGISSPNPALNAAVAKKGKTFKYDASFLLQFQKVFTEQPSLEFHNQVKSLIGDNDGSRSASGRGAQTPGSGRQSSRGGGGGAFPFGSGALNPPGGQSMRGTSSEQRFAMANAAQQSGSKNPMGSFNRAGSFPMGSGSFPRNPSHTGSGSGGRQNSRRGPGGSNRRGNDAQAAKDAKAMPLTAGMDLKPITVSASGWKPSSVGKNASAPGAPGKEGYMDPEMVQRKVKAALNKMTPENFERISDGILTIASQSKDETDGRTLRQVIQLTFEKATDEAHWASMYAKFCKKMLETMSPDIQDEHIKDKAGNTVSGGNLFRKYLLNRCQTEFERGWRHDLPEPEEGKEGEKKSGEAEMLSDEYYKAAAAKRRGLGLVQFIGELYKLGMLTERIMIECVHKLVDSEGVPDEAEIESLSKLLRTIGSNLDKSEKGRPMMDVYFGRIQTMVDHPDLASRMKFMLMDVIDLRKAGWVSKEANKGPKTLDEVRAEAEAAQAAKAQEAARSNQRGGGGRPPAGRGDARNFSGGYQQQAQSNHVAMDDLRRLKGSANRSSSGNVTLGPASMFSSRSNSGRRQGPGGSLGRPGEDSGPTSRTGTPPANRDSASHSNAFSLLANMETENPASPPSAAVSPAITKAVPDSEKKDQQ